MEKHQKAYILKNLESLIEDTICNAALLAGLTSKDLLTSWESESIRNIQNKQDQARELYDILIRRMNSYDILMECLSKTKQSGALNTLQKIEIPQNLKQNVNVFNHFPDVNVGSTNSKEGGRLDNTQIASCPASSEETFGSPGERINSQKLRSHISYDPCQLLGIGRSTNKVYKGKLSIRDVAVKVYNCKYVDVGTHLRNLESLKELEHKNIRQFLSHELIKDNLLIAFELCLTSLDQCIKRNTFPVNTGDILMQATDGLKYLHDAKIVHGRLISENILLKQCKNGICVVKISGIEISELDSEDDIYALGCIFNCTLNATNAFAQHNTCLQGETEKSKAELKRHTQHMNRIKTKIISLMRIMMDVIPSQRPDSSEVFRKLEEICTPTSQNRYDMLEVPQKVKPALTIGSYSRRSGNINADHQRRIQIGVGIDLGTANCRVVVFVSYQNKIIPNKPGKYSVPSIVSCKENGVFEVGEFTKNWACRNKQSTFFDFKRMIGRRLDDEIFKKVLNDWPFNVVTEDLDFPRFLANKILFTPETVVSKLFKNCVEFAEKYLSNHMLYEVKVTNAVITIPPYFNENQKRVIIEAGKLAGLKSIDLLLEPTAAAITYRYNCVNKDPKRVLIFDLGAGTFDIAIVDITADKIKVLGDGGDLFLGGDDFDAVLVDHCIEKFNAEHNVDIRDPNSNPKHLRSLSLIRDECERRKIDLSTSDQASIIVPCVFKEIDMDINIRREKYEKLIQPVVDKLMRLVLDTLQKNKISKDEIEEIVLAGASTWTPKILQSLQKLFNGKSVNSVINPDDAVAYGAAVHAPYLLNQETKKSYGIVLVQVSSVSLGIKSISGKNEDHFAPIIKKGTVYPVINSIEFPTHEDNQDRATISVYEGEDSIASRNVLIGTFELEDIPKKKAGEEVITVGMQLDENGLLRVTATSIYGSNSNHIDINLHRI